MVPSLPQLSFQFSPEPGTLIMSRLRPHTHSTHNGKAENAVKTVKRQFKKCKASGHYEFVALLDWRNTPTEGIGTSPVQRPMGRRCKTLLPKAAALLKPRFTTEEDARALTGRKQRQQYYYNRNAKPLKPITPGETVRMKLPGHDTWSQGTCTESLDNRSYMVKVGDTQYRRNRRHILKTNESTIPAPPDVVETLPTSPEDNLAKPSSPSKEPLDSDPP